MFQRSSRQRVVVAVGVDRALHIAPEGICTDGRHIGLLGEGIGNRIAGSQRPFIKFRHGRAVAVHLIGECQIRLWRNAQVDNLYRHGGLTQIETIGTIQFYRRHGHIFGGIDTHIVEYDVAPRTFVIEGKVVVTGFGYIEVGISTSVLVHLVHRIGAQESCQAVGIIAPAHIDLQRAFARRIYGSVVERDSSLALRHRDSRADIPVVVCNARIRVDVSNAGTLLGQTGRSFQNRFPIHAVLVGVVGRPVNHVRRVFVEAHVVREGTGRIDLNPGCQRIVRQVTVARHG